MPIPSKFYKRFSCKTSLMALGTGLAIGYFATIIVPPWLHPLVQFAPVPVGGIVAVLFNLWNIRSYFKGKMRGAFEYVGNCQ